MGGRPELWKPFETAFARLGPNVPEPLALSSGYYADPVRASAPALARLDAAIGALRQVADPADIARVVDSAIFVDRLGGCRQTLWQVVHDGRAGDGNTSMYTALITLSIDDYMTGQWEEADALLDELLGLSHALGCHILRPAQHVQALLAAARGDFETTWALTDEMSRWAEPRGMHAVRWYGHHARTLAAMGQGDFDYACQHAAAISSPGTFTPYVPHALWVTMDFVEAADRTNHHAEAAAHVAAMRDEGIAALSPRLALLAGASAAIAAPDDEAGELFDRALALPGVDSWPFDLARVQLAYGARLQRTRARIRARQHLSATLETFQIARRAPVGNTSQQRAAGHRPDQPRNQGIATNSAHTPGTPDRNAGRGRDDQQGDRTATRAVSPDSGLAPPPGLSQTRYRQRSALRDALSNTQTALPDELPATGTG